MFPFELVDRRLSRLKLCGEISDLYVDTLGSMIDAARLNDRYPSSKGLLSSVWAMDSLVHRNLYDGLWVHSKSGLPVYADFVRVASDRAIADNELCKLASWKSATGDPTYDKLVRKRAYLKDLTRHDCFFRESTRLLFRKIESATGLAKFRIILDRFDASGEIIRLTVEICQSSDLWSRKDLKLEDDDVVRASDHLKGLVYRLSHQEAEYIYAALAEHEGISVENVIKGTLGPFVFMELAGEGRAEKLRGVAGKGAILCVGLQIAGCEQLADTQNDPISNGIQLSLEARDQLCSALLYDEPFHVLKDRKFVICDVDRRDLESFCECAGTRNIIYEV